MADLIFFYNLLSTAGVVGKAILLVLVTMSVFCWSIIFFKFLQYKNLFSQIKNLKRILSDNSTIQQVSQILEKKGKKIYSPLVEGVVREFLYYKKNGTYINEENLESFQRVITIRVLNLQKYYRSGISFLALCSSSAPFIGLLGTVVGVIATFRAISIQKATSLAVVAPGLAEALVATALGIFVAIPALVFYNYFGNKLKFFLEDLDIISIQILSIVRKSQ